MFVSFANPFKSEQQLYQTTHGNLDLQLEWTILKYKIQNKIPTICVVIQNWNGPFQNTKNKIPQILKTPKKTFSAFDFMWMVWFAVSVAKECRRLTFIHAISKIHSVSIESPLDRRTSCSPSCKKNSKVHTKIHDPPKVRWKILKVFTQSIV